MPGAVVDAVVGTQSNSEVEVPVTLMVVVADARSFAQGVWSLAGQPPIAGG